MSEEQAKLQSPRRRRRSDILLFLVALALLALASVFSLERLMRIGDLQEISVINTQIRQELHHLELAINDAEKAQLVFFLTGRQPTSIAADAARVSNLIADLKPGLEYVGVGAETLAQLKELGVAWRARHLRIDRAISLFRQGEQAAAIDLAVGIDTQSEVQLGELFEAITDSLLARAQETRDEIRTTITLALVAPLAAIAIILAFGGHYYRRLLAEQASSEQSIRDLRDSKLNLEQSILKRNAELVKLTKELKAAHEQKDRFLAMLGHELRNPLSPMLSSAEYLIYQDVDEATLRRTAHMIYDQCRRMTRLVEDLMDIGQIASGEMRFEMQAVDFRGIVESIAQANAKLAADQGTEVIINLPDEPVWVNGDGDRLAQVVDNLIGNALKFTDEEDTITVRLETAEDEALLRVVDTGRGMKPELAREIFEPFYRGDADAGRGLGLGLSIVSEIVRHHDGEVVAHSDGPGEGTEMSVSLPRLPIQASAHESDRPARKSEPSGAARRFLIVDDYPANAQSLSNVLAMKGHEVETAASGEEAIEKFRADPPDVVLLDLGLPDIEGVDVGRMMLEIEPSACLIAVTGMGHDGIRSKTSEAGFSAHLTKPVRIADLLETVESVLQPAD